MSISPKFYEHLFFYESKTHIFLRLNFRLILLWRKKIGVKAARKMLVKLTPECTLNETHSELISEGKCDTTSDCVREGQSVFGMNEIDETSTVPHVTWVTQNRGDRARRTHHHT